jgi:hypothetical protein
MIFEGHGGQHLDLALALALAVGIDHVVPFLGMFRDIILLDDPHIGHDFAEDPAHRIIGPIGTAHHQMEFAADTGLHLADRAGEGLRPPPAGEMGRFHPAFVDERARRRENPC